MCRLDTFATAKIFVRNYDGTRSYHQVHVKSQSLKDYYNLFQASSEYHNWQYENRRTTNTSNDATPSNKKPTMKFRSFTNAFCPCCLTQKQRDCANHVQINLINSLKALENLRRFKNVAEGMKNCSCDGHKNKDYLRCPTSLSSFMDAVLCAKTSYPSLSADSNPSESIENQQNINIKLSAEKDIEVEMYSTKIENRNIKREGAARQTKSIPLLNWGPLFKCYSKECAYQKCANCGVNNFFSESNLCNIERNLDIEVTVRKYENVSGRSRGMQMEVVEVKMNDDQLLNHIIHCATLAIPHEWNVVWNAHARTICVNKSSNAVLNLMTDFSAVLDHDVQDKLNTAIPCRSNQCIFLATHSPRNITLENKYEKRVQKNDIWHFWSAQGGILEANSYYHSICTRHILKTYSDLQLSRVNIFTDGCAEQYKSRRNAYFVASLSEDTGMEVTHNYAPTASFKTMVDGQGNVNKSLYRKLERGEEEGTRCQTTYQLFLLFVDRYPIILEFIEDAKKCPMTITNRHHRYLVDIHDATPEMLVRAEKGKDVIVTDYLNERWDAHPIKGIKSLFSLIATKVDGQVNLLSRKHACACEQCMKNNFFGCLHIETTGLLKKEPFTKLPFKELPVKQGCSNEELERVSFFKWPLDLDGSHNIVIAIRKEKFDVNDEPFVLSLMTKKIKQATKDIEYDYTISGTKNKVVLKRGTWFGTVKLLCCQNQSTNIYYIPLKASEIKVPLLDTIFTLTNPSDTRENYIKCIAQSVMKENNQTHNIYIIDDDSLESLRNADNL